MRGKRVLLAGGIKLVEPSLHAPVSPRRMPSPISPAR
jgi:hypothetical protein